VVDIKRLSCEAGAQGPVEVFVEGWSVAERMTLKELMDLEPPELLEELTGRAGAAAALRLSSLGDVVVYANNSFFSGVHVLLPGECTSAYITTWDDGVGGSLGRKEVESILVRALSRWNVGWRASCYKIISIYRNFPTKSVHRGLLEARVGTGA
jgi:hypothetical protein